MGLPKRIAFFGSSLVSAYWNGAATYYRGIIRAMHGHGHQITFFEPDSFDRQKNRDISDPPWARVVIYSVKDETAVLQTVERAREFDLIIKASGVGIFDELLEAAVLDLKKPGTLVAFWDVDAPATLDRLMQNAQDPFRKLIPQYDCIFTYGGGNPVISIYKNLGAPFCIPIYNGLDPDTHFPVPPLNKYQGHLSFLGNRLPDREKRVEEFFMEAARRCPQLSFILGGSGWSDKTMPSNVKYLGHIYTAEHNVFNSSPQAVLNIARESMARFGFSPATRVFEAAGAAACIITDFWNGIEQFFDPESEILVARSGEEVASLLEITSPEKTRQIGRAALKRVLAQHTYSHRIEQLENFLGWSSCPQKAKQWQVQR